MSSRSPVESTAVSSLCRLPTLQASEGTEYYYLIQSAIRRAGPATFGFPFRGWRITRHTVTAWGDRSWPIAASPNGRFRPILLNNSTFEQRRICRKR